MASLVNRNGNFQVQWYVGSKQRRRSLNTDSLQVAKERLRQFESKLAQGQENPLPTRTPIGEVAAAYVTHIRTVKTAKSAQTDVYYLRQMLGPCSPEIEITSQRITRAIAERTPWEFPESCFDEDDFVPCRSMSSLRRPVELSPEQAADARSRRAPRCISK